MISELERLFGFDKVYFDPKRRLLIKTGTLTSVALVAGITLENIVDLTPSALSAPKCPVLPTDGNPAECTTVGDDQKLVAQSKFSRYYFIDTNGDNEYDAGDRDVMGVPNARLLVESLKPAGSSDFVQPDYSSRRINKNSVEYFDKKKGVWRQIQSATVLEVPADGGNGLALISGNPTQEWRLNPGDTVDKIWGPVDPRAKRKNDLDSCLPDLQCDWNCVQWVLVSRLMANADITRTPIHLLPNDVIHKFNGVTSSITDYIYYWDTNKVSPKPDHNFINTPVVEGSELWKKEGLSFKGNVARPEFISVYR